MERVGSRARWRPRAGFGLSGGPADTFPEDLVGSVYEVADGQHLHPDLTLLRIDCSLDVENRFRRHVEDILEGSKQGFDVVLQRSAIRSAFARRWIPRRVGLEVLLHVLVWNHEEAVFARSLGPVSILGVISCGSRSRTALSDGSGDCSRNLKRARRLVRHPVIAADLWRVAREQQGRNPRRFHARQGVERPVWCMR